MTQAEIKKPLPLDTADDKEKENGQIHGLYSLKWNYTISNPDPKKLADELDTFLSQLKTSDFTVHDVDWRFQIVIVSRQIPTMASAFAHYVDLYRLCKACTATTFQPEACSSSSCIDLEEVLQLWRAARSLRRAEPVSTS